MSNQDRSIQEDISSLSRSKNKGGFKSPSVRATRTAQPASVGVGYGVAGPGGGVQFPVEITVTSYEEIIIELPEGATTYTFRRTKSFDQVDSDGRLIKVTVNYPD